MWVKRITTAWIYSYSYCMLDFRKQNASIKLKKRQKRKYKIY